MKKMHLPWKETRLIGGNRAIYLDNCHAIIIEDKQDYYVLNFTERTKKKGKDYCTITKKIKLLKNKMDNLPNNTK